MDDYEVVAEQLSKLGDKWRDLEARVAEVERVNARLEEAALTTARALGEVSRHWDAVYDDAAQTGSTTRSRPRATTMRLGRAAASHRTRFPQEPVQDDSRDATRRAGIAATVNPRVGCL